MRAPPLSQHTASGEVRSQAAPKPRHESGAVRAGTAITDDGQRLHWRTVGSGPPIVCNNGVGVSTFFWKYLVSWFRERHTVLVWDYRGHGRSDRRLAAANADLRIERHADDCAQVMAAAGIDQPALVVGHSMGCQVSLELRRRHPERVAGLVLLLGTAGKALETFFDFKGSWPILRGVHDLMQAAGPLSNHLVRPLLESPIAWNFAVKAKLVDPMYTRREDLGRYLSHLSTLDQRLFWASVMQLQHHDAWDLLPHLDRPLLVIAAENDKFTPMWCSQKMVAQTPGAELLVLADASHAALVEQPETLNHRIDRFILSRIWPELGVTPNGVV